MDSNHSLCTKSSGTSCFHTDSFICQMFLQFVWSPPVINSGTLLCISGSIVDSVHQSTNQAMKPKELSVDLRDRIVSMWGKVHKNFCSISDLHCL